MLGMIDLSTRRTILHGLLPIFVTYSDAIRSGGPPLQTVVSHQLAQTGQLVRRERSFEVCIYLRQNLSAIPVVDGDACVLIIWIHAFS
jgi:hypothetical protein